MTQAQAILLVQASKGHADRLDSRDVTSCRPGFVLVRGAARVAMARRLVSIGMLRLPRHATSSFTGGRYFEITSRGTRWLVRHPVEVRW